MKDELTSDIKDTSKIGSLEVILTGVGSFAVKDLNEGRDNSKGELEFLPSRTFSH